MKRYFVFLWESLKLLFNSKYRVLTILFFLWLYRIDFIQADGAGLAKALQVLTTFGMLLFMLKQDSSLIVNSFTKRGFPVRSMLLLFSFGILSTLWAYLPTFAFFLSFQNVVVILLLIWAFKKTLSFVSAEKLFLSTSIVIMLFESIFLRVLYQPYLFVHYLSVGSMAAICISYCLAELLSLKIKDRERVNYLKGTFIVSIIILILSTSSGANASAVFGIIVALLLSKKKIYGFLLLIFGFILYLNQDLIQDLILFIMPGKTMEVIESGTGRATIWAEIFKIAEQRPFIGWGFACVERLVSNFGTIVSDAHNNFIGFYGSLGLIGLFIYTLHFLSTFSYTFKRRLKIGYRGLIAALGCATLNGYSYGYLSGKTCSITIAYFAVIVLSFYCSKYKLYRD